MLVGEYMIVMEDAQGNLAGERIRSTVTGHPIAGEEIRLLGGDVYVVNRVVHEDEPDAYSERQYTTAHVYVRPSSTRSAQTTPAGRKRDVTTGLIEPLALPGAFDGPPLRSVILPPFVLVVIVANAYQQQATYYRGCKRAGWRLIREGRGWILQSMTLEDLWTLSRRAKRHLNEFVNIVFMRDIGEIIPPSPGPSVPPSESPPKSHESPLRAQPEHRPTLRLVCPSEAPAARAADGTTEMRTGRRHRP